MANLSDNLPTWLRNIFFNRNDKFYLRNSYMLGSKQAVYLDVDRPYEVYNTIAEPRQVIDKDAAMFSNMIIKQQSLKDNSITDITDVNLLKLLERPNPLQSQNEWLSNYRKQYLVYGNQFLYKNITTALSNYPTTLFNISPRYMSPYLSGKVFDQLKIEDIILYYEYAEANSQKKKYDPKDILYTKITDLDNPIIGVSPLTSLRLPLSNTKLAYDYRNIIMGEKGAIGILSNQSKDSMGAIPLRKEEKEAIQNAYLNNYGIGAGQQRIHITEASLNWQPMTYPTKDLLLFEEVDANKLTIVDHFGSNINLFSSKNQTYENVRNAIKQVYQDTIQPAADQFLQALSKFIGLDDNYRLVATYEHIPILQDDEEMKAQTTQTYVNTISQLVTSGIINQLTAVSMLDSLGIKINSVGGG